MAFLMSKDVKATLVQVGLVDGQSDPESDPVDMQGYEGVVFVGNINTVTGAATVKLTPEQSTATGGSYSAISTAANIISTAGSADKFLMTDVYRPRERFVKCLLTRAGANSVYGGTMAYQYGPGAKTPVTHSTTTADTVPVFHHPQTT